MREISEEQVVLDEGPFYHGTKADLHVGDLLTAGNRSNYKFEIFMNHIYFTALPNGAGLAAALAKGA
ncbi:MAG TPA: NAD(+)--rifampin ADP-ribosyltransferase [Bacteroidales bacterium]|nr:NAD(+)--rifampin ADP-ribosyltransferase [Bacteroidales bacterium]